MCVATPIERWHRGHDWIHKIRIITRKIRCPCLLGRGCEFHLSLSVGTINSTKKQSQQTHRIYLGAFVMEIRFHSSSSSTSFSPDFTAIFRGAAFSWDNHIRCDPPANRPHPPTHTQSTLTQFTYRTCGPIDSRNSELFEVISEYIDKQCKFDQIKQQVLSRDCLWTTVLSLTAVQPLIALIVGFTEARTAPGRTTIPITTN